MYKILLLCSDLKLGNEIEHLIGGSGRTIIKAEDSLQAEIISKTININMFIVVSADSFENASFIKEIKKGCLYHYTPVAALSYSNKTSEEFKNLVLCSVIKLPLSKNALSRINDLIIHDINILSEDHSSDSYLILNNSGGFLRIKTESILFFESSGHASVIYTCDGAYPLPFTLKEIESMTEGTNFFRCHRSYIINTENILRIDKTLSAWEVYFYGCEKTALVSRQNKHRLSDMLMAKH